MSKFLTTHAIAASIEEVILSAKAELMLVSPYLQLSKTFFNRLKDADERKIKIHLVYGKKILQKEEESQLNGLKNLSLHFCKELHAKCYFNEEIMVITSMNMYEFSEKNNREMGILLTKKDDPQPFTDAVKEYKSILQSSTTDKTVTSTTKEVYSKPRYIPALRTPKFSFRSPKATSGTTKGFCIRCGKSKSYDVDKPYCLLCARAWNRAGGYNDHREKHCHQCGKKVPTITYDYPRCISCTRGH